VDYELWNGCGGKIYKEFSRLKGPFFSGIESSRLNSP
jgi:hypothetical protein